MPAIRQDPTTHEWVIIATERARRPHDFQRDALPPAVEAYDPKCPFCPGNEHLTPPEDFAIRPDGGIADSWRVRAMANKFAALVPEGGLERRDAGLFRGMTGYGKHEVVVETQRHDQPVALMELDRVEDIIRAYRARHLALREDQQIRLILIFKNHGRAAGTSLEHPHSQIVATPVVPASVRIRYETATRYHDDTGRCIHCVVRDEELRQGTRVLIETGGFAAFHPFASRVPFETWIVPKSHSSSFGRISDSAIPDLATVLQTVLKKLYYGLGNPDFNYIIHSAPVEDEDKDYYIWHIQVLPRLTLQAGFELWLRHVHQHRFAGGDGRLHARSRSMMVTDHVRSRCALMHSIPTWLGRDMRSKKPTCHA
jgi:UDPglucose--hexose-1-phosphate uridylyltransferase